MLTYCILKNFRSIYYHKFCKFCSVAKLNFAKVLPLPHLLCCPCGLFAKLLKLPFSWKFSDAKISQYTCSMGIINIIFIFSWLWRSNFLCLLWQWKWQCIPTVYSVLVLRVHWDSTVIILLDQVVLVIMMMSDVSVLKVSDSRSVHINNIYTIMCAM